MTMCSVVIYMTANGQKFNAHCFDCINILHVYFLTIQYAKVLFTALLMLVACYIHVVHCDISSVLYTCSSL